MKALQHLVHSRRLDPNEIEPSGWGLFRHARQSPRIGLRCHKSLLVSCHSIKTCHSLLGFALLAMVAGPELSAQAYIAGEDEASYDVYQDGWQSGDRGGRGFGEWTLIAPDFPEASGEGSEQYAGFFIAEAVRESDLGEVAREGKAFGIFANGTGFEETVGFRAFNQPLAPGDVFSLRFKFAGFSDRFEDDRDGISSVGIALRTESSAESIADLTRGRVMVLASIEGLSTYQISDAAPRFNTRVFIDPAGVEVGITVREGSRYDLQITTLSDQVAHHFRDRSFKAPPEKEAPGEDPPCKIKSFALFNLNGGDANAYFGAFQVSAQE